MAYKLFFFFFSVQTIKKFFTVAQILKLEVFTLNMGFWLLRAGRGRREQNKIKNKQSQFHATLDLYRPRGKMRLSFLGLVVLSCLALYHQPESLLCYFFLIPSGYLSLQHLCRPFPASELFCHSIAPGSAG